MVSDALKPLRIGLTGGIGSGKSTVATMLADCGAWLVDTDAIAHALTAAGGAAMPALRAAATPWLACRSSRTDGCRASMCCAEPSVEPSSMTITSTSGHCCAATECNAASM